MRQILAWTILYSSLTAAAASIFGTDSRYPTSKFVSSKARAPLVERKTVTSACTDGGYYFLAPRGFKVPNPGPMILDGNGTLIWTDHFSNAFGGQAYDLRVQEYRSEHYLTFWLGDDRVRGHGAGHYYMLNSSYEIAYKVGAANDRYADLHEFTITPAGTALLIAYEPVQADLRPLGRPFDDLWNQAAYDCIVQEVNIETGEAVFEWRASQHINMTLSYLRAEDLSQGTVDKPFDFVHLNSVDKDEDGNYIISSRNMHAVLYIDGRTGDVLWTLGGKANDFKDLSGGHVLNMAWQHDARFVSPAAFSKMYKPPSKKRGVTTRLMTIFDNAALDWDYQYGPAYSRGLLVELTYPTTRKSKRTESRAAPNVVLDDTLSVKDSAKVGEIDGKDSSFTVRLIREFVHPSRVRSSTQGSVQTLTQKDETRLLIGYGINPVMTEYNTDGSVLCDMHFGSASSWESADVQSYRAYKFPWTGRPSHPPAAVLQRYSRDETLYVSWNGASEIREWQVQMSDRPEGPWDNVTAAAPKTDFETSIVLPASAFQVGGRYIRVLAIGSAGSLCAHGISRVIDRTLFGRIQVADKLRRLQSDSVLLNAVVLGIICIGVLAILIRVFRRRRTEDCRKRGPHAD